MIFDGTNIDRQHLRPPVLAILLETIERIILIPFVPWSKIMLYSNYVHWDIFVF